MAGRKLKALTLVLAVVVLAGVSLGAVAAIVLNWGSNSGFDEAAVELLSPGFVIDKEALAGTNRDLKEVTAKLDALPQYPGTRVRPSELRRCSVDESGELSPPRAAKTWRMQGADSQEIANKIASDLAAAGWDVRPADEYNRRYLTIESSNGWEAVGEVKVSESSEQSRSVFVTAQVRPLAGRAPCRLASDE